MARSLAFAVSLALLTAACGYDKTLPINTTPGVTTNVTGLTSESSTSSGEPAGSSTSGSDSGTSATTTTTGTTDAVGTSTTTTGSTTTGSSTEPESTSTTFPAPIQECVDNVDPGDECTYCMCVNCLELWEACQDKYWCRYLQECSEERGCYGIDCLSQCMTAIDFAGGVTGEDFLKWLAASDCMEPPCRHMCPW